MNAAQLQQLLTSATAADRLVSMSERAPMAFATLWRPRCTRWNLDTSRPRGCGAEMVPVDGQRAVFTCETAGCEMEGVAEERTSQRDTVREIVTTAGLVSYMIGGANRAGKSESAILLAILLAAGREPWWVQEFCRCNSIPIEAIPEGPATADNAVIVSALTFNDSLEYHRPKLDRWLPAGTVKRNWRARDQAECVMPGGGRIVLKAAAQGREKFQGNAPRAAVLDEEHPEDIFEEVTRGLAETDGPCILSMTPLKGLTWTYKAFLQEPAPGYLHSQIIGLDNPHVRSRALLRRFAHLAPEKRDARLYGKYSAAKGLIYPSFSRAIHVAKAGALPNEWRRYRVIDFGFNFACLWAAHDPDRDQLIVYRTLLTQDVKLTANGRQIKNLSGLERYKFTLADPADKDGRQTLARMGIPTLKAKKDVEAGIDAVAERLALTADKYPRLVVQEQCRPLLDELRVYRRNPDGTIRKEKDHLSDCLRYLCYWLTRARSL